MLKNNYINHDSELINAKVLSMTYLVLDTSDGSDKNQAVIDGTVELCI